MRRFDGGPAHIPKHNCILVEAATDEFGLERRRTFVNFAGAWRNGWNRAARRGCMQLPQQQQHPLQVLALLAVAGGQHWLVATAFWYWYYYY
jgi:hypothetical protein